MRRSILPLDGYLPRALAGTPHSARDLRFAADGKFVAYTSSESGRSQVSVASFPSFAEKRQISIDGGTAATWRRDGKEIFFRAPHDMLTSTEVRTGTRIESGAPKPLLQVATRSYAPTGDGQRFLVVETQKNQAMQHTMVVVNRAPELKQP